MSNAIAGLQAAGKDLATGRTTPQAREMLDDAARQLSNASEQLTQAALAQSASAADSAREASESAGTSNGGTSGPGGGQRQRANLRELMKNMAKIDLGKDWTGVDDKLKTGDRKGRKSEYDQYYRNANKTYLQRIQAESQKWSKEGGAAKDEKKEASEK